MHDTPAGQRIRRWPLYLIAAPAAVSIWSGWVGLGQLCGFGLVHPLPGIWDAFRLNTAITLPVGVESYGAYALGAWLNSSTTSPARKFARWSAVGSLALGMLGQVAYHLMAAARAARAPWPVTVLVACLPVVTLGFGAALTHLLRSDATVTEPVSEPDIVPSLDTVTAPACPAPSLEWPAQREAVQSPARSEALRQTRPDKPVSVPAIERPGHPDTAKRTKPAKTTARAVAIVARTPDISGAELGRKLGLSERSGRRLLAQMAAR
jgi:hypothetical protein